MELKWSFIIRADYPFMYNLLHYLDSEDIYLYQEGEEGVDLTQYFSSVHFNHLSDPNEIYAKAYQLCSFVNAIEFIIQENKRNMNLILLDKLVDIENKRTKDYNQYAQINKVDIDFSINKTPESRNNHLIAKTLLIAKSDLFVQNILFMIAQGMDFHRMYQVLDEIKYFLKSKGVNLKDIGFPKKGAVNDFTHTANNYQALGLRARHGSTGHEPPKVPMTIPDAQKLLTDIIKAVFDQFYGMEFPVVKDMKWDASDIFE